MHDAFEAGSILEKLPLKIESIACYDDILLVGTKDGPLLQYKVKKYKVSGETKYEVALERSNKTFSKKPIQQLYAVPELFLLISLSDNIVSVHDLATFSLITTLTKTKGATLFAADVQTIVSLSGEKQATLQICVATRRKLQIMFWKNRDFIDLVPEMNMYDIPRAMVWFKDRLCVGFKRDYFIVKIESGESKELFPLGSKQTEPVITYLKDAGFIVGRDDMSIFIDKEGQPAKKHPVKWTDIPIASVHEAPYIISVLPKCLEVRTIDPHLMIQSISLQNAKCICQGSGQTYIASSNHVWRLTAVPTANQIRQLIQNKEFELALQLANMTEEPENEKQHRINQIQTLYAVNLFCKQKFEESMKLFVNLDTDPSHVIGLYPNLLPAEFKKKLEYPEALPNLEGSDLEKGLLALTDYLNDKKRMLNKVSKVSKTAIKEGNTRVTSKKSLVVIDQPFSNFPTAFNFSLITTVFERLRAWVASLLRLKDNKVHIEEAERSLKKKEKFSELIILYEQKGLHEKALNLLMKQAARPKSLLQGCDRTVQYLQHLGPDHIDLIFEYADWVIKQYPEDGLKIFTEDLPEVESLPRRKVLDYLENLSKGKKDLAIKYLEHVIYDWNDTSEEIHSRFAQLLREKVQAYMKEYILSLPEGHMPVTKAGTEPAELGEYRKKLIDFLNKSTYYKPEELLPRFPMNEFFEERAILLGRLGRHEVALALYVIILRDAKLAEEYCMKYYNRHKPGDKDVYYYLLKVYLQPPDSVSLGLASYKDGLKPEPNLPAALKIMEQHAGCIDTTRALELLPPDTKIQDILGFMENVLELKASTKHQNRVLRNMLFSETLHVHEQRMFYQKEKVVIDDLKSCAVCKKRIGNSFFARYPDGVIVHYGCCKDPKIPPGDP
ncbi:vam6/Vps39-like protein [Mercenaria mercenaria]|uniref:vam6/Vps39-like protein n=1 Tax=Mercenaria mercenaria TaxID=6596 RepID=UPI00234F500D|nr:vam6/Vps39-like protein [Mercenaria mercenaria]